MITIRRSAERGHFDHGWLNTYHSFSFGDYRDPAHMGFGPLRVINEDFVAPGAGFPTHPHQDMEIVTWVLEGALAHRDNAGGGHEGAIRPGDLQRMSAGTGVQHSEFNASESERVHLLQIWLRPERRGIEPGYEQTSFEKFDPAALRARGARQILLASRDGREGSVTIHQDADVWCVRAAEGQRVERGLATGRKAWVQVARGAATLNGKKLAQGDGAAVENEARLVIEGGEPAELLVFDMA